MKKLKKGDGEIFGVCSGLADYFNVDVTLVRIAFVLSAVFSYGYPFLVYIVLACVMPED